MDEKQALTFALFFYISESPKDHLNLQCIERGIFVKFLWLDLCFQRLIICGADMTTALLPLGSLGCSRYRINIERQLKVNLKNVQVVLQPHNALKSDCQFQKKKVAVTRSFNFEFQMFNKANVVGILIKAKKHGLVFFDGEIVFAVSS